MRIHLDDPLVLARDDAAELVVTLLLTTGDGRHVLAIADELLAQVRTILSQATQGSFARRLSEALDRAEAERDTIDRTVVPGTRPPFPHAEIAVAAGSSEHCVFTVPPERVGAWLHEPLFVLTENDIDGVLILAAAFGAGRDSIHNAMTREWVRINGRGGTGEIPPRLQRSHSLERLFVLIDSDRDTWGGPVSNKATEIQGLCKAAGIPCHILARREAENHLPLSLIAASAIQQGRASDQLKQGCRTLKHRRPEERWVTALDSFFADCGSGAKRWESARCKKWLRELLPALASGAAELEPEALEHLTTLLDELERWL